MPAPQTSPEPAAVSGRHTAELRIRVPVDWKRWLEEAALVRGLSVSALVRQCIRGLMIERHNGS